MRTAARQITREGEGGPCVVVACWACLWVSHTTLPPSTLA